MTLRSRTRSATITGTEFRVYLVQQTGPKTEADASMRFVRFDDLTEEERAKLDQVQTIVREKQVPVSNAGNHKPSDVCRAVSEVLGVRFTPSSDHVRAWKHYGVRPETGDAHPERTDARYCVYDEPHRDYVYTDAWITKLTTELSDPERFAEVIGHAPIPLPDAQTDMVEEPAEDGEGEELDAAA